MGQFVAEMVAKQVVAAVAPIVAGVARCDGDLAGQMRRATASVLLNLVEGARRVGKDRVQLYRVSAGSAAEVRAALVVAAAFGYAGDVARADALLDRLLGLLWGLTH